MTRETDTASKPWLRTEEDYLAILSERENFCAGEYDNLTALSSLQQKGLITFRPGSEASGLSTRLYPVLVKHDDKESQ